MSLFAILVAVLDTLDRSSEYIFVFIDLRMGRVLTAQCSMSC